ncbi:MAG: GTPase ObgE [Deltaproteobacteria bacterium]|nr:GTPase ObgE [Deltaproteobacteria bacterium]
MKFIDEAVINVQSGNGGRGCVSFRREKFIPRGGPDGGDGGKGGDVVLLTTSRKRTLYQFRYQRYFKAKNGAHGQGKRKTGKNGQGLIIEIPPGTLIKDAETGQTIKDLVETGETLVLVKGGRGGQGNARFKTSTHRTPRFAQPGEPGETKTFRLELKLLADVGIIGLPNAGKSTLISAVSSARPKIGDYPFTTLSPSLGVVRTDWGEPFVIADIPGLIKGAHKGTGLGIRFLRHIERTTILVHLVDVSTIETNDPLKSYDTVNKELSMYNQQLIEKPQIVVLNKLDLPGAQEMATSFQSALKGKEVISISALTGKGIEDLTSQIIQLLDKHNG